MKIENFQENATICLVLFITALFCISALYSFHSPQHIIHANSINKVFLKSLLESKTVDLKM